MLKIVNSIKNGDEVVFQQVFNEYHEKLYFYILKKSKSEYFAEEVVQMTFIKLWNSKENLSEEFTISTQLYRIATTTLIDLIRKKNTSDVLIKKLEELKLEELKYDVDEITSKMEVKDLNNRIEKAIEMLPPIRRKVFKMSRLEHMSYSEIAKALSISPKTVENHISRAIKQLRPYLTILFIFIITTYVINNTRVGVNDRMKRIKYVKETK